MLWMTHQRLFHHQNFRVSKGPGAGWSFLGGFCNCDVIEHEH
jgi:hypothetical protein